MSTIAEHQENVVMGFIRSGSAVSFFELRPAVSAAPRPALVLIHALGSSLRIWDEVVAASRFPGPVLRYDLRGHGLSELGERPYTVPGLAADVLALLDRLGIDSFVACGLSVGGLIAQELVLLGGARARGAVLCGTAARIGSVEGWQSRIEQVRAQGLASLADAVLGRWFSPAFREREPDLVRGYRCLLERTPDEGYLAMLHALRDADLSERVRGLRAPALVISGELDEATPPADGRRLAGLIPGARFEQIAGASHLFSVEKPRELAASIDAFGAELGLG